MKVSQASCRPFQDGCPLAPRKWCLHLKNTVDFNKTSCKVYANAHVASIIVVRQTGPCIDGDGGGGITVPCMA